MNKVQAPSLLLEDFNYLFNRAIYLYINKRYNIYDINLLTTDDIRVLKATAILDAKKASDYGTNTSGNVISQNSLYGGTYEVILPSDYLHILNCVCNYHVVKQFKCYDSGTYVQFPATRLTADLWSLVINNFYMRPMYKRPYYYVHNVNSNQTNPTNPYTAGKGTDITSATSDSTTNSTTVTGGLPKTIKVGSNDVNNVERSGEIRYGNVSLVRMEIRYGHDDSLFELKLVHVVEF